MLEGRDRAKYGAEVVDKLSKELTGIYGKGYSKRILYQCLKVYRMFPEIVNEARSQLLPNEKMNEVRSLRKNQPLNGNVHCYGIYIPF